MDRYLGIALVLFWVPAFFIVMFKVDREGRR